VVIELAKRKSLAARAAGLLGRKVQWRTNYWVYDPATGSRLDVKSKTMGEIRQWLRARDFIGPFNKRKDCQVCLQGALLLALADDPEIPDGALNRNLLKQFDDLARDAAYSSGVLPSVRSWEGVIKLNDNFMTDEEQARLLLNTMAGGTP
jgi:hypothetical protein